MRWLARAVLVGAAVLLARPAQAVEVPKLTQRVEDKANVLQPQQRAQLEEKLAAYEQRTGHQFAVLTVPSLDGDPIEDFSIRVAEAWRLGDKSRDDGLLLVLALQERRVRIEVGYGLEGVVTDAVAGRVIADDMTPLFRSGNYAEGLAAGLTRLMAAADGEAVGPARRPRNRSEGKAWVGPLIMILIFLFFSGGGRGRRRGFFMLPPFGMGGWTAGGRRGGGGFGGFGGGGGSFGGGGASGGW